MGAELASYEGDFLYVGSSGDTPANTLDPVDFNMTPSSGVDAVNFDKTPSSGLEAVGVGELPIGFARIGGRVVHVDDVLPGEGVWVSGNGVDVFESVGFISDKTQSDLDGFLRGGEGEEFIDLH